MSTDQAALTVCDPPGFAQYEENCWQLETLRDKALELIAAMQSITDDDPDHDYSEITSIVRISAEDLP